MNKISQIIHGDSLEELDKLEENSIDSCVTDPPYGLGFMNKDWDKFTPKEYQDFCFKWGTQILRVLKPGGYLLAFSGTRTYHRMVCGLEDAEFKIKDMINWVNGSGFPKSLDISKAIDKYYKKENEREYLYTEIHSDKTPRFKSVFKEGGIRTHDITKPATKEALKWEGWGSALKPAHEPVVLAQKPYEGTYANNILKWGVGGLNIDECRIDYLKEGEDSRVYNENRNITHGKHENATIKYAPDGNAHRMFKPNKGRWPTNLILTHHPECKLIGVKKMGSGKQKHNSEINRKGFSGNGPFNSLSCGFDVNRCQHLANFGEELKESYDCHPDCPIRMLDEQSGDCPTGNINPYEMKKQNPTINFLGDIKKKKCNF